MILKGCNSIEKDRKCQSFSVLFLQLFIQDLGKENDKSIDTRYICSYK